MLFSYIPWITASEGRSLTTQGLQHQRPILLEFRHYSPPFLSVKTIKKPEVDKKIQACEIFTLTEYFPRADPQHSISFIDSELVKTLYSVGLLSNL